MNTTETLRQIAALLKTLPANAPSVCVAVVGDGEACPALDAMRKIAGAEFVTHTYEADVYHKAHAIDSAHVEIDGVEFRAQRSRPLTAEERTALDAIALERVATIIARGDVISLDVHGGVNLGAVLTAVEKLATRENVPVWFAFSGTEVTAKPGDTAWQIGDAWAVARVRAGGVL